MQVVSANEAALLRPVKLGVSSDRMTAVPTHGSMSSFLEAQEVEDRAPHGVHVAQPRGNGFRAGVDDVQGVEDRQERQDQGGTEQDGQEGTERVGQVLEECVDESVLAACLRAGGGLDVVVGGCGA